MSRSRAWLWILAGAGVLFALSRTRVGGEVFGRVKAKLVELIEREEGLRLEAYKDFAGHWTIGYGHKIVAGDPYVPFGTRRLITREEAINLLDRDMVTARDAVLQAVRADLNANQIAALASLAYNIGAGAFRSSTLVKKLNAGDLAGAQAEFARWIYADGKQQQILINRRAREAAMFASPETYNA